MTSLLIPDSAPAMEYLRTTFLFLNSSRNLQSGGPVGASGAAQAQTAKSGYTMDFKNVVASLTDERGPPDKRTYSPEELQSATSGRTSGSPP